MSALIIEDGSVVDGANSYVSVSDADAYHATRITPWAVAWLALSESDKEACLIDAARRMDALRWRGIRRRQGDGLAHPRDGMHDCSGNIIASDTIPQGVKELQAECAAWLKYKGAPELHDANISSRSVGPLSITYFAPTSPGAFTPSALQTVAHLLLPRIALRS